jgi:hypothetical protein
MATRPAPQPVEPNDWQAVEPNDWQTVGASASTSSATPPGMAAVPIYRPGMWGAHCIGSRLR